MIIQCISNKIKDLPKEYLHLAAVGSRQIEGSIIIEKKYTVYAIILFENQTWYYICDETYTYYPVWNPAPFFKITNNTLSKHWCFSFNRKNNESFLGFKEWASEPYFYDRLTDKNEREVKIFQKYKKLIDEEANTAT